MSAALTPRVRNLLICDNIRPSMLEADVYHLRGARSYVFASAFPLQRRLHVFVTLSSTRPGRFPGYIKVVCDRTDQAIFFSNLDPAPEFLAGGGLLPLDVPVHTRFPEPGGYTVQLWFFQEASGDILKMEQPFHVLEDGS
jgi:hypothetical protein